MAKRDFTICLYCDEKARKTTGVEIYPSRPDLAEKIFWKCDQCGAYVGCHPGTDRPLGRLADAELRGAKMTAHDAFDALWKRKHGQRHSPKMGSRSLAYAWLAEKLGIDMNDCHIGYFDVTTCRRVAAICCEAISEEGLP